MAKYGSTSKGGSSKGMVPKGGGSGHSAKMPAHGHMGTGMTKGQRIREEMNQGGNNTGQSATQDNTTTQ